MPNLVKIVDNIGWLFIDKVMRMGVGLLVGVWVARYLGPQQFGLFSFATAYTSLYIWIASLELRNIVVRDIIFDPTCKEEVLGTAVLLQLTGGVIAYSLIMINIIWLRSNDTEAIWLVAILGSVMLFKFGEVAMYWFESQVLSKYTVWVQNISFLVFAAVKVALIMHNAPLLWFAWVTLADTVLVALFMFVMLGYKGLALRKLKVSLTRAKVQVTNSWPLILTAVAMTIYMKIDLIMLGQIMGDDSVGIYSSAVRISEIWYFIPMVIVASVYPAILDAKKQSETLYYKNLQRLYDLIVWLSVAVALPISFFATPVIVMLFGPAYAEAATVLAIHIWASVFVSMGVASSLWLMAENRQIMIFQRACLGAIINASLNYILIPEFGIVGSAWATLIAQVAASLVFDIIQKDTRPMFFMKVKSFNFIHLKTYVSK
jgi:PST family polysaccharide transporter